VTHRHIDDAAADETIAIFRSVFNVLGRPEGLLKRVV
jgi:hypothetical protein